MRRDNPKERVYSVILSLLLFAAVFWAIVERNKKIVEIMNGKSDISQKNGQDSGEDK